MKVKVININNYLNWNYVNAETFDKINLYENPNPINLKLFNEDVFEYKNDKTIIITHSVIRSYKNIAGVLIMNKTYGRNNKDYFLYKCIPHDKRLPEFLIPINIKKKINFDKYILNKYITFKFDNWNEKHPFGILCQTIGDTNNLLNYFEYQLFSKNLNFSITDFSNKIAITLKKKNISFLIEDIFNKYKNIENRVDEYIITIDPSSCKDYDDALSFLEISEDTYKISVYISNVAIILDYLNLWDSFSERISTIYLPEQKRPMIPTILSEYLCSLKKDEPRFAIAIDLSFKDNKLINIQYKNVLIQINENLSYDEANKNNDEYYNKLLLLTKKICKKYKYINNIKDSHDLVSYYMLFVNNKIAEYQETFNNGIYRSVEKSKELTLPNHLDENIISFFKIFNSLSGIYSTYEDRTKHLFLHDNESSYLHITSPIRRLVDLLNLIKFQENLKEIKLNNLAENFYIKWINRLEYINTTTRAIKKVQNNCSLLFSITKNPNIINNNYKGYLFDKIIRNDGLYQYSVYLVDLNIVSKIIIEKNYDNYDEKYFKLYLFLSEYDIKKKIKLKILI